MKDVGLRIRVQRELRQSFLEACRAEDKPAAQVIREFMRDYVRERQSDDGSPQRGDSPRLPASDNKLKRE